MTDINTTSINDLPTESGSGNVASEPVQSVPLSLDQNTISQIVNGLQQASLAGATSLPSRDIPQNTEQLTSDQQVQPNYIPQPAIKDYINDTTNDNIHEYYRAEKMQNSLDSLYDEIQAPLLLGVLYFLFQLPFFKKAIFKYFPFFCHTDGNYNFNGLLFTCALFGFIFYSLSKTVKNLGT
jgi:hypothetical protein